MKDIEFTVSDIKEMMDVFSKNGLGSMKLAQGSFSLELESRDCGSSSTFITTMQNPATAAEPGPARKNPTGNVAKAPIVGTFYAAPAPDKEPYVTVGAKVKKGDVLFIIESMKLMNEVTSEFDGIVGEIFVQNGAVVEYGQPVMAIE